jgi:hypothetical protein
MTLGGTCAYLIYVSLMLFAVGVASQVEKSENLVHGLRTGLIASALLTTGLIGSLSGLKLRDVFSTFDLHSPSNLTIRCIWIVLWCLLSTLDYMSKSGKRGLLKLLESLAINSWTLVPFVVLSGLATLLQVDNPLYNAFHLERM